MRPEDAIQQQVSSSRSASIIAGLIDGTDTRVMSFGEIEKNKGISPTADTSKSVPFQKHSLLSC